MIESGRPQYSTDSKNMSVQTELQLVKASRFGLNGITFLIKVLFGFIKTIITEVTHPGSS